MNELDESIAWCKSLTKRTAGNFYFSFLTLPADRLRDMCVLYAFMRVSDDLGDDLDRSVEERRAALVKWRDDLETALAGGSADHPVFPALADLVARHQIPAKYLQAVIAGVEMDLDPKGFETFAELADYCYHVAGAVGLCCIHVWGFEGEEAIPLAVDCGCAFQLTNILRDLGEDALMGRVYLPREDLRRFDYDSSDIAAHCRDERFQDLMQFEVARAGILCEHRAVVCPFATGGQTDLRGDAPHLWRVVGRDRTPAFRCVFPKSPAAPLAETLDLARCDRPLPLARPRRRRLRSPDQKNLARVRTAARFFLETGFLMDRYCSQYFSGLALKASIVWLLWNR